MDGPNIHIAKTQDCKNVETLKKNMKLLKSTVDITLYFSHACHTMYTVFQKTGEKYRHVSSST